MGLGLGRQPTLLVGPIGHSGAKLAERPVAKPLNDLGRRVGVEGVIFDPLADVECLVSGSSSLRGAVLEDEHGERDRADDASRAIR